MTQSYFDISPALHEGLAVFPGDQPFRRNVAMSFGDGDHLELSSITTTLHIGAHADAPSHYHGEGVSIEARDLNRYIGPCSVFRVQAKPKERIGWKHLPKDAQFRNRVLIATNSFTDVNKWNDDFNSFDPQLLGDLGDRGVKLIGIDTPSIDPSDSKELESHKMIFKKDMSILEGLWLKDVPAGEYFLVALPLAIQGADASPVRAALWPAQHQFK